VNTLFFWTEQGNYLLLRERELRGAVLLMFDILQANMIYLRQHLDRGLAKMRYSLLTSVGD
jgi:hypothetical protein